MDILFITSSCIGDAVMANGALGWFHDRYPRARFTIACGPAAVSLFEPMPRLKRIIPLMKKPFHGHWLALWAQTAATSWEAVVDMRSSGLAYLLKSRERRVYRHRKGDGRPKAVQIADGLRIGPAPQGKAWFLPEHRQMAASLLERLPGKKVILCPKANWIGKEWPMERFAELARRLHEEEGAAIVTIGTAAQAEAMRPIEAALPESGRLNLCGATDLPTATALLAACDLFVGNDSGMLHLAAASGCPTLGLYGPTNDAVYGPWGERTAVIRCPEAWDALYTPSPAGSLMGSLAVAPVLEAARALMRQR